MTRTLFLSLALFAACAPNPRKDFAIRVLPAEQSAEAPAVFPDVAVVDASGGSGTADLRALRFLAARAVAQGAGGVAFRLPPTPAGTRLLDYPEEAHAVARVVSELKAARLFIEGGSPAAVPLKLEPPVAGRAWDFAGRRYLLLVNEGPAPAPLGESSFARWRALFSVRADPRSSLAPCEGGLCLPAHGVLWLERRPEALISLE